MFPPFISVSDRVAGPSRSADSFPLSSQLHSSTASELLQSVNRTRYSTFSVALDDLLAHFAPPRQEHNAALQLKGRRRELDPAVGAISPGMVLELSGPPGGGKTAIAIAVAISARVGERDQQEQDKKPEVLMIGKSPSLLLTGANGRY